MELETVNPLNVRDWDEAVLAAGGYSVFHSSAWGKVLSDSYNYRLCYLALFDRGGLSILVPMMEVRSRLTGVRGVSLPFSDYCEPILNQRVPVAQLFDEVVWYGKEAGWRSVELRGGGIVKENAVPSADLVGHTLDMDGDEDQLLCQFRPNTRRNISKAIREGVTVEVCDTSEALDEYYRLHCRTRKRHGLPVQPRRFFNSLYEHVISEKLGCVVIASYKARSIAGAVCLRYGEEALCKYAASAEEYLHLRPNNLVIWEAIRWHCRQGCRRFSFGRTDPCDSGLRRFKESWGTRVEGIRYYKYDIRARQFVTSRQLVRGLHNKVFRQMPVPLLRMCGEMLYRHVG